MFFACVAGTFPTDAYGVPRALSRNIGMVPPGEAEEKRESQRYHEWQHMDPSVLSATPHSLARTNTPVKKRGSSFLLHNARET